MKITIKTFAAIAALTAVALFSAALFSCGEPEVETPGRGNVYEQYNPLHIGAGTILSTADLTPSITSSLYINDPSTAVETDKDVTISFPAEADILKKSNSEIGAALKQFLSFHTFTNPNTSAVGKDHSTVNESATATEYEFVSRLGLNGQDIKIRLKSIPTQNFVAKFNEKYTYAGGYKVNLDTVGVPLEHYNHPIYGNIYLPITVTSYVAITDNPTWNGTAGHQGWALKVNDIADGTLPLAPGVNQVAVQVYSSTIFTTGLTGGTLLEQEAEYKKLHEEFKSKFELQKWDGSAWIKDAAEIKYLDTTSPNITGYSAPWLYAVFTPADLTPYRIVAVGVADLTTNSEYYGQKQKIKVSGGAVSPATYFHDTVAGDSGVWIDGNKYLKRKLDDTIETTANKYIADFKVTSDGNGSNVVLTLLFNKIPKEIITPPSTTTPYPTGDRWLKDTASLSANFTKNVKIMGTKASPPPTTIRGLWENDKTVFFVNIQKVETRTSPATEGTNLDELVIYLDPSYRYNSSGKKYIIIGGLDFQLYAGEEKIIFSDPANVDISIGGVKYWDLGYATATGTNF